MTAVWANLETHVVDGAFPLQRCVGSTDHSGVFVTRSAEHAPGDLALKLIPLDTKSAQAQLARWRAATRLSHPYLLRIFRVGVCQLDGRHYLYVLMEFADQTLAQVLEGRALTQDEVREMLAPALGALAYLHNANLAQGSLKPANVLVVGDQLKLASDTLRLIGNFDAVASTEDDVRALGAMLCEALTLTRPSSGVGASDLELPAALPAAYRDVVARCLSKDPQDRPTVASLLGWLRGEPLPMMPPAPPPAATPAPHLEQTIELASGGAPEVAPVVLRTNRSALGWVLGALLPLALGWLVYDWIATDSPRSQSTPPLVESRAPTTALAPAPVEPQPVLKAAPTGIATDEVLPSVSQSALDTVRGTLRVTVRVNVNQAGNVVVATTEDPGPSRYFERRSLEAARKWTFAPAGLDEQRSMRLRFAFTRSGVMASASPLP